MSDKKPTKFDQAAARARGETTAAEPQAMVVTQDVTGMLGPTNPDELQALLASGEYEAAPQLLTVAEGQTVTGLLEGNGPDAEFTDEHTGIVRTVKTWVISRGGLRVSILSSAQLDRKLPPFVGGEVRISRGQDKKHAGGIYTEYLVMGPKRSDGTVRNWATRPQLPVGSSS